MKFVVFWEYSPEDAEKIVEKTKEMIKEMKADPEKYAEKYGKAVRLQDGTILNFAMIGQSKGFNVWEGETEEQLHKGASFWFPELKLKAIPIRQPDWAKEV